MIDEGYGPAGALHWCSGVDADLCSKTKAAYQLVDKREVRVVEWRVTIGGERRGVYVECGRERGGRMAGNFQSRSKSHETPLFASHFFDTTRRKKQSGNQSICRLRTRSPLMLNA